MHDDGEVKDEMNKKTMKKMIKKTMKMMIKMVEKFKPCGRGERPLGRHDEKRRREENIPKVGKGRVS